MRLRRGRMSVRYVPCVTQTADSSMCECGSRSAVCCRDWEGKLCVALMGNCRMSSFCSGLAVPRWLKEGISPSPPEAFSWGHRQQCRRRETVWPGVECGRITFGIHVWSWAMSLNITAPTCDFRSEVLLNRHFVTLLATIISANSSSKGYILFTKNTESSPYF